MAQAARRALIVASAAPTLLSGAPGGCWAEELASPHNAWAAAGYDVDIATPGGAAISWSPDSMKGDAKTKAVEEFLSNEAYNSKATKPMTLENVDENRYDVVFVPGGHGAMVDLPDNQALQNMLTKAWARGAVIASVCHGPAALVHVKDAATNEPLLRGRRVACFTNEEEESIGLMQAVPWSLEDAVKQAGAKHEAAPPWNAHVVRDGRLVTGQNPASSPRLAEVVLEAVAERRGA